MLCLSRRRPSTTWPECASAKQHKKLCRGRLSGARLRIFAQESALLRRGFCFTPAFGRRVGCARNGLGAKSKRKGEKKYRNGAPSETGPEPPETGPEFGNRDLNPRNGARFSRPVSNGPFLRFSQAGLLLGFHARVEGLVEHSRQSGGRRRAMRHRLIVLALASQLLFPRPIPIR